MHEMINAKARHPLLCKWWMRSRAVQAEITADGMAAASELYCPMWAKPLDWLYDAVFGAVKPEPIAAPEKAKAEPITMAIVVDTTELKVALALLEQIAVEAKKANAMLDAMRAYGSPVVTK